MNRYLWTKETVKCNSWYSRMKQPKQLQFVNYFSQVSEWASKEKVQFIYKLQLFLQKIGLAVANKNLQASNICMQKLQRISKKQQKQLYLNNLNTLFLDNLINNQKQYFPNYSFYKNKTTPTIRQLTFNIDKLHTKFKNYYFLQQTHDYIQWMFPNHYESSFNSCSKPLNYIESYLFLNDLEIGLRMLKSIYIFFDFMGISINPRTGQLQLISQQRLKDVMIRYTHNHLRIMRILACLSVTGFRKIANNLIDLLSSLTSKGEIFHVVESQFKRSWLIYHDSHLKKAKQMCFLQAEQFPSDHPILKLAVDNYEQLMTETDIKKDSLMIKQQITPAPSSKIVKIQNKNQPNVKQSNNKIQKSDNAISKASKLDNNDDEAFLAGKTINLGKVNQINKIDNNNKDHAQPVHYQQKSISKQYLTVSKCIHCNTKIKKNQIQNHSQFCYYRDSNQRPIDNPSKNNEIEEISSSHYQQIQIKQAATAKINIKQQPQTDKIIINQQEQVRPNQT